MRELNELNLELVTGGARNDGGFNSSQWRKQNCRQCTKERCCGVVRKYQTIAAEKAKFGSDYSCPNQIAKPEGSLE